jgi:hypothetical protein
MSSGMLLMKTMALLQFNEAGEIIAAELIKLFPPFDPEKMQREASSRVAPGAARALIFHGIENGQLRTDELRRR